MIDCKLLSFVNFHDLLYFRAGWRAVCSPQPKWNWMMDMINAQIVWKQSIFDKHLQSIALTTAQC